MLQDSQPPLPSRGAYVDANAHWSMLDAVVCAHALKRFNGPHEARPHRAPGPPSAPRSPTAVQRNGFLNLLLYLNRDWQDEWGGFLELWDADAKHCVQKIKPIFNRCVVFQTSAQASYHGHPTPLACPEDVSRKSLALYYFRDEHKTLHLEPTHYRARPNESLLKHALVAVDRAVLRAYSFLKRHTPINDRLVSRVMKRFEN